jgi:hypothetical protein
MSYVLSHTEQAVHSLFIIQGQGQCRCKMHAPCPFGHWVSLHALSQPSLHFDCFKGFTSCVKLQKHSVMHGC